MYNIKDCIYITYDKGKTWSILCRLNGEPYTNMLMSIQFIKRYIINKVGLSTYDNMKKFIIQWDNYK
jgi:hypothetical protein